MASVTLYEPEGVVVCFNLQHQRQEIKVSPDVRTLPGK